LVLHDDVYERMLALVGAPLDERRVAPDPVALPQIRRWMEAFGEDNPIYLDEAAARAAGRRGIVAPPAMLAAFTARGLKESRANDTGINRIFAEYGLITPGVGVSQTYETEIRLGDRLIDRKHVESVSPRKSTSLGTGCFITVQTDFTNQHEHLVGVQRLTVFAYQPGGARPQKPPQAEPVRLSPLEGRPLPLFSIALDRLGVIACTMAAGDFNAAHYDPDVARSHGFDDIFTDVYAAVGFAQRYLHLGMGNAARINSINLRLGASFYAGDELRLSGAVQEQDARQVKAQVRGLCGRGLHMTGVANLAVD
jgi:acyl dehydratase